MNVLASEAVRVDNGRLEAFGAAVFAAAGMNEEDAKLASHQLVYSDVRGVHTHGIRYLRTYADRIKEGKLNGNAKPHVIRETLSSVLWDGDNGLGHVVSHRVMADCIERIQGADLGVLMAVVRNSHHFGASSLYALQAAEAGLISLVSSNTPPIMAPHHGRARSVGNAPTAWGVPAVQSGGPYVFDAALTNVAGNKVAMAMERGVEIPDTWILGPDGNKTTNPNDLRAGGGLLPIGGHKGYSLAVLMDILSGVLSGGLLTDAVSHFGVSHFFIVIKPTAFLAEGEFDGRMSQLADFIHATPLAPGAERIYLPGEPELDHQAESQANGLELDAVIWQGLEETAAAYGQDEALAKARR